MQETEDFAFALLEEAKRFLERAIDSAGTEGETPNLHASLLLGFASIEAHLAAFASGVGVLKDLTVHERSILEEREVALQYGKFELLKNKIKMIRLEDRVLFIYRRFSGKPLDRNESFWGRLSEAVKLRNALTHPKGATPVSPKAVGDALQAIIDTLDALFVAVYGRNFPSVGRGLQSKLTF